MKTFTLQSLAGGFLDEDLKHFNKVFDDWCVQFESMEEAQLVLDTLDKKERIKIVVEPQMGENFRIAICDLQTKNVKVLKTRYKSALSAEGAFANLTFDLR